jgi:hypothetical protein
MLGERRVLRKVRQLREPQVPLELRALTLREARERRVLEERPVLREERRVLGEERRVLGEPGVLQGQSPIPSLILSALLKASPATRC